MAWLDGWGKRQLITIDHTKVDSDLSYFPVKIIIPAGNPIFSNSKSDGSDIRFTESDGTTLLSFEREVHDNTQEIAVYHVKIPLVSSTSDTAFYIYYDNPNATDASNPSSVWDSNYELVMHMGPTLEDSTGNGNNGTNYGSTLKLSSNGYYRDFDGLNDYILAGSNIPVYDNMTIEMYCQAKTFTEIRHTVLTRNFGGGEQYGFRFETNQTLSGGIVDSDNYFWVNNIGSFNAYTDYYISMLYSETSNTYSIFRNTEIIDSDTLQAYARDPIQGELNIGRDNREYHYFDGNIYEIRISSTNRSVAWIKATSYTLYDQLLTIGAQETQSAQPVSISAPVITLTQSIPIPAASISVLLQIPSTAYTATALSPMLKVSSVLLTTQINFQAQTQSPILKLSCQLETGSIGFSTSAPVPDISTGCRLETSQIGFNISMPVANVIAGQEVIITAPVLNWNTYISNPAFRRGVKLEAPAIICISSLSGATVKQEVVIVTPVLNWNSCVPKSILKRSINLESSSVTCIFSLIKPLISVGEECIIQALPLQFSHAQGEAVLRLSNRLIAEAIQFSMTHQEAMVARGRILSTGAVSFDIYIETANVLAAEKLHAEPMLFSCDLVAPALKTGATLQAELLTWLFSMPSLSEYRKVIVYDSGISKTLFISGISKTISLKSEIETTVSKSSKL